MVADPAERFPTPDPLEAPLRLRPDLTPLGGSAVRAVLIELSANTLREVSLYEAAFNPVDVDPDDITVLNDRLVEYAQNKGLLHPDEADWLRARLQGEELPELPDGFASGKNSTVNYIRGLIRDYPGELNHEGDKDRRHYALAMKGILNKFIAEGKSVEEIQAWVDTLTGQRNAYNDIDSDDIPIILLGGLDAVFRATQPLPLRRVPNE